MLVAFDATKSPVGLALGGMWAAYALAQFPGGVIGDRFGERSALVAALAGTALGRAALAVAVVGGHTVQAVSSSLPTFLVEHRALDTGGFGAVRTVSLLLSALGSAVTGALADAGG